MSSCGAVVERRILYEGHRFNSHLEIKFFLSYLSQQVYIYIIYYNNRPVVQTAR